MPTRIKICGITRSEDALAAARLGADAIGFVFHSQSPRHVTPETAASIARALPAFVTTVGLFVDADEAVIRATLARVPLDLLQFHGAEPPEFCARFDRPWIKAIAVAPEVDLLQSAADYKGSRGLLLDAFVPGMHGGTGTRADWNAIPGSLGLPIILAGGLTPANVGEAIRVVRPWAVDVSSGVERAKGVKDPEQLAAFIQGVRDADG
jgi:phosphoribosylanthranilate isomerase